MKVETIVESNLGGNVTVDVVEKVEELEVAVATETQIDILGPV